MMARPSIIAFLARVSLCASLIAVMVPIAGCPREEVDVSCLVVVPRVAGGNLELRFSGAGGALHAVLVTNEGSQTVAGPSSQYLVEISVSAGAVTQLMIETEAGTAWFDVISRYSQNGILRIENPTILVNGVSVAALDWWRQRALQDDRFAVRDDHPQ